MASPAPMIEVQDLTKRYAGHYAIQDLSFSVQRGEVVGLLGPNGAGKSTTMRILSGFISATSGSARVAGYDVFHQSQEVRRRIGYMPENNPLYREMRVREYLKFRARLKGVSVKQSRSRVDVVLGQCGLTEVQKKVIGHLSKGYQQRVGLADALVHKPELIILDEPTIGLDPHQIRAVRQLIRQLGQDHTLLISTHILPEVEMTCSRVLILHRGRIVASDHPEQLQAHLNTSGQVQAEIAGPASELRGLLESIPEILRFDMEPADGDYHRCALWPKNGLDLRPVVYDMVRARGWRLRELTRARASLEDVFVQITGGEKEEESL